MSLCFAVKVVPLPQLKNPEAIQVNEENIYITEGFTVSIFSLKDFKLKRTFGRKGEGPKEFKGYILAYVQPGYIFINSPNKVSYFTLEGDFIKEKRVGHIFGRFKPLGKKHFVGYQYFNEKEVRNEGVYIFDSNFEKVKELYRRKYFVQTRRNSDIHIIEERPPFFYIVKEKVFLDGVDGVDGVIYIFDENGKEINALRYPFERIRFTKEHEERFVKELKRNPYTREFYQGNKHRLKFPDYFPLIRMFHVTDNKIYVMTYKEKDGKNEFVILDMKGKLLNRMFIPISPFEETTVIIFYTIKNGKLYLLKDNEETEEWEVRIFEIKQKRPTSSDHT